MKFCFAVLGILLFLTSHSFAEFATDPFYDQRTKQEAPSIDSISEYIDPFSGNLYIVQSDLHLPGNGGLDLTIMRTYNSQIWGETYPTPRSAPWVAVDKSPVGIGWYISMGILRNPPNFSSSGYPPGWGYTPVFELPDGTKELFFSIPNDDTRMISKGFWVLKFIGSNGNYNNQGRWEITSPEGKVYIVDNEVAGYSTNNTQTKDVAQVTKIQNAARNAEINIKYKYYGYSSVIDYIDDSTSRRINFSYSANGRLGTLSYGTYSVSYEYQTIDSVKNYFKLTTVNLPTGNPWQYSYDSKYELSQITFPAGGIKTYTYAETPFKVATCDKKFLVISRKTASGREIPQATWEYGFSTDSSGKNVTNITTKDQNQNTVATEAHTFYGWGNTSNGTVWRVGLPMSKSYNLGGQSLAESYSWMQGTPVSDQTISNQDLGCESGFLTSDSHVYVPFLETKSITRDSKTYSTNYLEYDTYGNPEIITETGDISRRQEISYAYPNVDKNIVKGKPSQETVYGTGTGAFSGTSSRTLIYDSNSGNPTQITKNGVTTKYAYDGNGNLSSVTDANNHATSYQWSFGKVSKEINPVTSPNYYISRSINSNGTVANETDGNGKTTSYTYDGLLRVLTKSPPAGNFYSYSYPGDSSYMQESRAGGGYWIQYAYDGFGRPSGSCDSKGITTTIAYTPYGTKDYTNSSIGDKIYYDYFGRIRRVVHKDSTDSTDITYSYSGSNVTVNDENNSNATLTYDAFGNPDEKYSSACTTRAVTPLHMRGTSSVR